MTCNPCSHSFESGVGEPDSERLVLDVEPDALFEVELPLASTTRLPLAVIPVLQAQAKKLRESPRYRRAEALLSASLAIGRYVVSGILHQDLALTWLTVQATTMGIASGAATEVVVRGFALARLLNTINGTMQGE